MFHFFWIESQRRNNLGTNQNLRFKLSTISLLFVPLLRQAILVVSVLNSFDRACVFQWKKIRSFVFRPPDVRILFFFWWAKLKNCLFSRTLLLKKKRLFCRSSRIKKWGECLWSRILERTLEDWLAKSVEQWWYLWSDAFSSAGPRAPWSLGEIRVTILDQQKSDLPYLTKVQFAHFRCQITPFIIRAIRCS